MSLDKGNVLEIWVDNVMLRTRFEVDRLTELLTLLLNIDGNQWFIYLKLLHMFFVAQSLQGSTLIIICFQFLFFFMNTVYFWFLVTNIKTLHNSTKGGSSKRSIH